MMKSLKKSDFLKQKKLFITKLGKKFPEKDNKLLVI